jgi:hypothetical protein
VIVWQGLGAYAFVVPFFLYLGIFGIGTVVLGAEAARQQAGVLGGLALLLSAALLYWFSQRITRTRPARTLVDKETGQEVVLHEKHTFFFVPIRYWAVLYAAIGAILVVANIL